MPVSWVKSFPNPALSITWYLGEKRSKGLFSQMSELMISPGILDFDGGFEDVEDMGVFWEMCLYWGLLSKEKLISTLVRRLQWGGRPHWEVILCCSHEPANLGFQALSAPVDLLSGNWFTEAPALTLQKGSVKRGRIEFILDLPKQIWWFNWKRNGC